MAHAMSEPGSAGNARQPRSRLEAALAKGGALELKAMAQPILRAGLPAGHRLLLDGRVLGEVNQSARGCMAYDDARGVWVGPFKRLSDLARFFLKASGGEPARSHPVIGVPTTKGRVFWSMHVDLVPREDEPPKKG